MVMAWFRLGGAGISAALKNAMNAVLNKKLGTSQVYDPNEWPEEVNLLGALEEKTVSSSPIVTFADGADEVPLKKCEITLPASLDGYSQVDVKHTKKNLLNDSIKTKVGGSILFAGASSASDVNIILPAGTYTMTLKLNVNINVNLYLKDIDTNTNITGFPYYNTASTEPKSRTFTLDHTTRLCAWTYNGDFTSVSEVDYCMIAAGSAFTSYEPYTAPTTHTADLGRTIYGGTPDVVKGEGTGNYAKVVFDGSQPSSEFGITAHTGFTQVSWIPYISIGVGNATFLSDTFEQVASIAQVSTAGKMWNSTVPRMFLSLPDTVQNASQAVTWFSNNPTTILYPIATPETFTFDPVPIDSKLGNNTLWAEQGDTEVTYRSMGTVYQYPEGEEVYF